LNCAWSRPIDGTAMSTRMTTGASVQMISIAVLWLVFDGIGFAALRKRTTTQSSSSSTNTLMTVISGNRIES